jgi:hypothetical protein
MTVGDHNMFHRRQGLPKAARSFQSSRTAVEKNGVVDEQAGRGTGATVRTLD